MIVYRTPNTATATSRSAMEDGWRADVIPMVSPSQVSGADARNLLETPSILYRVAEGSGRAESPSRAHKWVERGTRPGHAVASRTRPIGPERIFSGRVLGSSTATSRPPESAHAFGLEPSLVYYSNTPGAGNHLQYSFTLPKGPTPVNPTTPGKSYNFQLNGALWFGMALCDTQSYPEQVSTCAPDSDSNIVDPAASPNHPGTAFLELQFYPPGWVPWPTWAQAIGAGTCDPTKWCAAMNVFSLLEDPVNGTLQNATCASQVGIETFQ